LDALEEAPVARLQALAQLVRGTPALRGVRLELRAHRRSRGVCGLLELVAELRERRGLEVADLVDLLAVALDPRLRFGNERLLALLKLRELGRQGLLRAVEVGGPVGEPLRHALLRFREPGRQLTNRLLLLLDDGAPPLLGDAALLRLEFRERVGALAC